MIWNTIKSLVCAAAPDPRYEAYLTKNPVAFVVSGKPENRHWVIGPYESLTKLARDLRVDATARASFGRACFGRRYTDLPPAGPQPSGGFRKAMESAVPHQINPTLINMREVDPTRRRGAAIYTTRSPTSIRRRRWKRTISSRSPSSASSGATRAIFATTSRPAYWSSPNCISRSIRPKSASSARPSPAVCRAKSRRGLADTIYTDLYASAQMADLLAIANIIIGQVKLGRPT